MPMPAQAATNQLYPAVSQQYPPQPEHFTPVQPPPPYNEGLYKADAPPFAQSPPHQPHYQQHHQQVPQQRTIVSRKCFSFLFFVMFVQHNNPNVVLSQMSTPLRRRSVQIRRRCSVRPVVNRLSPGWTTKRPPKRTLWPHCCAVSCGFSHWFPDNCYQHNN